MSTNHQDVTNEELADGTTGPDREPTGTNRGRWERIAAVAVGGTLLAFGIRRRSLAGAAATLAGGWLLYRGVAGNGSSGPSAAGDRGRGGPEAEPHATETEWSVTVGKSADEVYELWRDPETMTQMFGESVEVTARGEDCHGWTVRGPLGRSMTWETRVAEDRPGEFLRWESVEGAPVSSEGAVHFRPTPNDRGTEVTLRFRFDPPGGALGGAIGEYLGVVPETVTETALRRFKNLAETGEIPTLEKNPSARGEGDLV